MNPYRIGRVGEVSSKYGYHPEQFEKDIEKHKFDDALFRNRIRNLVLEEPARMDIRFHQATDELRRMKEEFGL